MKKNDRVTIRLTQELLKKLEGKGNVSQYIRKLIKQDLRKQKEIVCT